MFKKLAVAGASIALLATTAIPAFAFGPFPFPPAPSNDLTVNNWAVVKTVGVSVANGGANSISGGFVVGGGINAGGAQAVTQISNGVNGVSVDCGCTRSGDIKINNGAVVNTVGVSLANSGFNSIHGGFVGGGSIVTNNVAAGTYVTNAINQTVVGNVAP